MTSYHYIIFGLFAAFAITDFLFRARDFPDVRVWRLTGVASTLLYFAIATYAPLMWDSWLGEHRLFDAAALPFAAQVAIGFLVLELGVYVWHRTMHNTPALWRWLHQMHHSAERVDIWGAFYFHPLDMIGWALLGSLVLVGGFGIGAEAAVIVALLATFCSMFQHANIRTPRWLGYLVTRPESHALHHQRGVHAHNYGDIPLWDIAFGTFRNPASFEAEVGFHAGGSKKIGAMLVGKEIA